jgi:hypothetical protein
MTDLTDVLHRATDDLAPEAPDLLLDRAVRRGGHLRRRRRVVTVSSAVAGVAAACVVSALTLARTDGAVAPQVTDPGPSLSTPDASREPRVTVDRHDFGATFSRIVPGAVTDEHDVPAGRVHEKGGYESTFLWNGYRVAVAVWPYRGGARAVCDQNVKGSLGTQTCVRVRGGWAVHDSTMGDQSLNRWSSVLRDNGFRMWVMIYNSADEKGSNSAGPPPLDVRDLERVATSPLWFG